MNPKRFLLVIVVAAVSAGAAASTASGAMTAEGEWYLGATAPGTTLAEGTPRSVTCARGGSSNVVLAIIVGSTLTKLEATGVECVGTAIKNEGGHGLATGKLKFTGVTVAEPAGCTVEDGIVETEEVKGELYMDSASSTLTFVKFEPVTAGGNFATIRVNGACFFAGNRILKGAVFGEASNPTSTPAATQPLVFSPTIDATTGGSLIFAGNEAHLSGQVNDQLATGEAFNAHGASKPPPPPTMTAEGEWFLGETAPGTTMPEATSRPVSCARGGPSNLVLTGTVGSTPTKLEATGVECVGTAIKNEGGHGLATGKLKFTGVTVAEPAGCTVKGGTVETEGVKGELYMDSASSTAAFVKFEPAEPGGNFATVVVEGTCGAAGNRILKGFVFGEASNPTSTPAATQPLVFSPTIDATTGGFLKFAGNEAHLSGQVNSSLSGGEAFMAH